MHVIQEIKANMGGYSFSDYLRAIKSVEREIDTAACRVLKVAVLRSYTVEMLEPILKLRLLLESYSPEFCFGDFNQYAQEILDPSSRLYGFDPDLVLLFLRVEDVLPDFIEKFADRTSAQWETSIDETVRHIITLVETVAKNLSAQILVQNFSPPAVPYWGIYESQIADGQTHLVNLFNERLQKCLADKKSAFIWDYHRLLQHAGLDTLFDPKTWYISRSPFRQTSLPLIGGDLVRYIFSILGKVKKCIVLDLDNTLWGGIAGEDGIDGVELGHDYPGICYRDFQKELLKLYNRGIILAINSKNNEEDAFEIIDNHPYMVLRRKHFAAFQINWRDKITNLHELAQELNIGIDSMIFIDDSPVECELIRQHCPECEVVCLPEKKYLIPGIITELSGIENIKLTDEDKKKGGMYKAQARRKKFEGSFDKLEDFLKGLEIEVAIEPASGFSIPRIAQLTQKTNQMNLTTRRYMEANIQGFVQEPYFHVFSVSSKDRFGDNGIIGVFILKILEGKCYIDTFLLSCRVIGRKIEDSMMAFIADYAREKGAKALIGEYLPTAKNKPAADMYNKFQLKQETETIFKSRLIDLNLKYPEFIQHILH